MEKKKKIHVAVIDDDDSFGRAIGRRLGVAGFEASVFSSAEEFLKDIKSTTADCLVLDIQLGGMSGLELGRHLTVLGRTTPVVYVTAYDEPDTREEAQRVGCSAYLCKPVPGNLLVEAIKQTQGKQRQEIPG
jgi:FixJ family two-component response regulator